MVGNMSDRAAIGGEQDRFYMRLALREACKGLAKNEVPVGALIVYEDQIIGRGYNRREERQEPTAHAEILALRDASQTLKSWRLEECTLYVTMEPCVMCAGALVQARVPRLVFGCLDPKGGGVQSLYEICNDPRMHHRVNVTPRIMEKECSDLLNGFFTRLRKRNEISA
jgi:tRNA(adenine34) deaminase